MCSAYLAEVENCALHMSRFRRKGSFVLSVDPCTGVYWRPIVVVHVCVCCWLESIPLALASHRSVLLMWHWCCDECMFLCCRHLWVPSRSLFKRVGLNWPAKWWVTLQHMSHIQQVSCSSSSSILSGPWYWNEMFRMSLSCFMVLSHSIDHFLHVCCCYCWQPWIAWRSETSEARAPQSFDHGGWRKAAMAAKSVRTFPVGFKLKFKHSVGIDICVLLEMIPSLFVFLMLPTMNSHP